MDTLAVNFNMPVMVVNGAHPGPTFTVTGGTYPTEFCGVEAAGRLYRSVSPANLTGKLIVVPVVNMPVLQFRSPMFALTESVSPFDGKMLASVFPGDPAGSPTEVLAHVLFSRFIEPADFHVDLRGGDLSESHMTHTIFLQGVGGAEMDKRAREMGTVFGTRYCRHSRADVFDTKPGTLIYEAVQRGVPSIISEAGTGYDQQPAEKDVLTHVVGVTNLLHHAGMLPGPPRPPAGGPQLLLAPDFVDVKATVAGMFKHGPDRGDLVQHGGKVGVVADLDGTVLETLAAPVAGVVHEMMPRRLVYPGDTVYTLAVVDGNLTAGYA